MSFCLFIFHVLCVMSVFWYRAFPQTCLLLSFALSLFLSYKETAGWCGPTYCPLVSSSSFFLSSFIHSFMYLSLSAGWLARRAGSFQYRPRACVPFWNSFRAVPARGERFGKTLPLRQRPDDISQWCWTIILTIFLTLGVVVVWAARTR